MNNNNNPIKEAQIILMKADPFLVESLSSKTTEELQELLLKLTEQVSFVQKQSFSWYTQHKETMKVIENVLFLRRIGDDDKGGVTLI